MLRDKGTKDFESWDKGKYVRLARENPIRALVGSEGGFFTGDEKGVITLQDENMRRIIGNNLFVGHMRDAILYRTDGYYNQRNF
jgi:hypothetical protein